MNANKQMVRECAECCAEFSLTPNPDASHGYCCRHWLQHMSPLIGEEGAKLRAFEVIASGGQFCPDKSKEE